MAVKKLFIILLAVLIALLSAFSSVCADDGTETQASEADTVMLDGEGTSDGGSQDEVMPEGGASADQETADEPQTEVTGDFFLRHVIVNGNEIINYNLQYPFLMVGNSMYMPLTEDIGRIFGFSVDYDKEQGTLKLTKVAASQKDLSENRLKNDNQDLTLTSVSLKKIVMSGVSSDEEGESTVTQEELSTDDHRLYSVGKYLYAPVRMFAVSEIFAWDTYYSSYYGLCVSTVPEKSAKSLANAEEQLYNNGLAKYITKVNPYISASYAQELLFLFRRASDVNDIDADLLMAIANCESHFAPWAGAGGSGARGIMQVMPSTGTLFGIDPDALFDAKTSIDFGSMYVAARIAAYGDVVKGLSAYNQGSARVNRGNYSTAYATRVLAAYDRMHNWLYDNGYAADPWWV